MHNQASRRLTQNVLLLGLCLFVGSSCKRGTTQGDEVIVGAVIDQTGNLAEPSWKQAIQLAERHANSALNAARLGELQFEVLFEDSKNDPATAVERAVRLVREEDAKAIIGDSSQVSIALNKTHYDADPANDLSVPITCGACTSGSINNPTATNADKVEEATLRNAQRWLWRGAASTTLIGQVLVKLLLGEKGGDLNQDGKIKVSIIASDEAFGRASARDIRGALTRQGATAAIVEDVYNSATENLNDAAAWKRIIDEAADDRTCTGVGAERACALDVKPDIIMVVNFTQQHAAVRLAYTQNAEAQSVRMLHGHGLRASTHLLALGERAEGGQGVSQVLLDGESGELFRELYLAEYGVEPVFRDSTFYDTAMTHFLATMLAAVEAKTDPKALTGAQIRDAYPKLADTSGPKVLAGAAEFEKAISLAREGKSFNYEGASAPLDWNELGNMKGRLAHFIIRDGAFVDIQKFDCYTSDECPPQAP